MKELKNVPEYEKDIIKAKVGDSRLYLQARKHHSVFNKVSLELTLLFGRKYKQEVSNILTCVVASLKKGDLGFTYTRRKGKYTEFNKNNSKLKPASYKRTLEVLELLETHGYLDNFKGYKDRGLDESMSACVVYTDKLISKFDPLHIRKCAPVIKQDSVVVRDAEGNDMKNVQGIAQEKQRIDRINIWLAKNTFTFGVLDKLVQIQRVFKYDMFTGGRLYFGALQIIKSERRPAILVNTYQCTEQDWSSQHYAILACLAGYKLPEGFKPYEIDVSDLLSFDGEYNQGRCRRILKLACMMIINSGNPTTSLNNVWSESQDMITKHLDNKDFKKAKENPFYGVSGKQHCSEIIKRLKVHNNYAEKFFKRKGGMWGACQSLDSQIMLELLELMMEKDCAMLPYHDSALCAKKDKETLLWCMRGAWFKVLGTYDNCLIDEKF